MSYPIFPDKYLSEPLLSAAELLAYRRRRGWLVDFKPPPGMVLCFQHTVLEYARHQYAARAVKGLLGECYLLERKDRAHKPLAGVAGGFGIGAPAAVTALEELAAAGARRFIAVGLAGGLQASQRAGDLLVCERALRDEGVSYHYLPAGRFALASPELVARLQAALEAKGQTYTTGASWTTDAPYRETRAEVEAFSSQGIASVEMEAAGLFAAGQALGVQTAAAFCIADRLGELKPDLDFDPRLARRGLELLFDAALEALDESGNRD